MRDGIHCGRHRECRWPKYPEILEGLKHLTAEALPPIMRQEYERVAPNPGDWPKMVARVKQQGYDFQDWPLEDLQSIRAPALVIVGDADVVRPEHAVEMFRLIPQARLAVLPATDHVSLLFRQDWLLPMIAEFLDQEQAG
jgi:pimeloyl-ACP methyl ester carboxylesterase